MDNSRAASPSTFAVPPSDFHGIPVEKDNPELLFEQLQVLGKGTFGTVIKARNTVTDEIVAIKQILLVNQDEIDIVRREIRILHECKHANIVTYRGTYMTMNTLWITMEYCSGGSVDSVFKLLKRPLTEPMIALVCREVLLGLSYLHASHKIHRDIKGGNVLLTGKGGVKLADFGVSTELLHTLSKRNSFIGTLYWMAPEAIQEKEYDERADIWSLGITVIEVAEGCPPRAGYPYARALFAIPKEPPPKLSTHRDQWSPLMHKFVERMLQKDPQRRPTAQQLLSDPFLAEERCATSEELQSLVQEVMAKADTVSTARRLGEESTGSSATFVQRDDSSCGSQSDLASFDDADDNAMRIAGGRGQHEGGDKQLNPMFADPTSDAALHPSHCHPLFHDGTLLQLPILHTEDIGLDELGAGTSSIAPITAVPSALELLSEEDEGLGPIGGVGAAGGGGQNGGGAGGSGNEKFQPATQALLAMYYYHRDVVYRSGVTAAAAERSQHLTNKYGSALKTTLRL